ncbi:trypsin-like peptidase domain-containing protein [Trichormus sp. NMC-1]|uniref:trypsin-like peptidase domain-containing protein n=1 Tax=Trichormus sp. NMC-1 TaxID=1853259 RepID=UPI0008DBED21|nr:trypsin-like peptidase domain-containing protein [Trichormus sp. NMC-1]
MTYTNESYKTRIARIYTSADENVINVVGGGFLISDQYIVTCAHVVADALGINHTTQEKPQSLIKLDFPFCAGDNKKKFEANVKCWKPQSNPNYSYGEDIAVLEFLEKLPTNNITFQLSLADTNNHQFSVLGFPEGRDQGVITKGKLLGAVGDRLGLVQMEVEKQSSFYIEPGFSGTPVWDEELASFVGIVVSSELSKYSDNTVGKPSDELRKDLKVAYMIPAKVLVETWSFLNQAVQEKSTKINNSPETSQEEPSSNSSSEFYKKRIAAKEEELAKVQADLDEVVPQDIELKLSRKAERLLKEIQDLKAKLN